MFARKSNRLTVGFNLRNKRNRPTPKSRSDDTTPSLLTKNWDRVCAVPAGLWISCRALPVRRLKPTVNKVLSLRDFLSSAISEIGMYAWRKINFMDNVICSLFFIPILISLLLPDFQYLIYTPASQHTKR